jgi:galactose mutarotase-like enzyme
MSGATIARQAIDGFDAISLENEAVRVTVVPELGAHVTELVDRAAGRDLLWHNPRTTLRRAPYGAHFDDWWSGGWDEIFPTGDRALLHDELLPYMGEMWSVPWSSDVSIAGDLASVTTVGHATMAPARMERRLWIRGDEPAVHASYRIVNLDVRPLPFLWGIHPVFAVTPDHRIDHPARTMLVGVSSDPSMGTVGETYAWPALPDPSAHGGTRDVRRARPREDAVFGGHWATDLQDGWLALTDTATRRGIAIVFPVDVFPHAWLWQVYGGWRGHHHLALEPWSGYPMQLEEAQAAGRARVLTAGKTLEAEVAFVLFDGLDAVRSVERHRDRFEIR